MPKKKKILHGNNAQIPSDAEMTSVYIMQAMSDIADEQDNVPLTSEAGVIRERNWSIENEK